MTSPESSVHACPNCNDEAPPHRSDDDNSVATQVETEIDEHVLRYINRRINNVCGQLRRQESTQRALVMVIDDTEAELLEVSRKMFCLQGCRTERRDSWERHASDNDYDCMLQRRQRLEDDMVRLDVSYKPCKSMITGCLTSSMNCGAAEDVLAVTSERGMHWWSYVIGFVFLSIYLVLEIRMTDREEKLNEILRA